MVILPPLMHVLASILNSKGDMEMRGQLLQLLGVQLSTTLSKVLGRDRSFFLHQWSCMIALILNSRGDLEENGHSSPTNGHVVLAVIANCVRKTIQTIAKIKGQWHLLQTHR